MPGAPFPLPPLHALPSGEGAPGGEPPELSIVVIPVAARVEDLRSCLEALHRQHDPPPMEILVPYDEGAAAVTSLAEEYPDVRFFAAPGLGSRTAVSRHHNALRTIGLEQARGRWIALTEDHARVSPTWAAQLTRVLAERPRVAAVGGAIECRGDRLLNLAVCACDFGRYQPPLPEGSAPCLSDTNVAYRRQSLEAVRSAWEDGYHEPVVHRALAERGFELWLTSGAMSWQCRGDLGFLVSLRERYVWGRSYAGTRASDFSLARRLLYAAGFWILPVLLTFRVVRRASVCRRLGRRLVAALPLIAMLNTFWALGELAGYLTRLRPRSAIPGRERSSGSPPLEKGERAARMSAAGRR